MNSRAELRSSRIDLKNLLDEKERRLGLKSYYNFFRLAWSVVWPQIPFKDNWHYRVVCDELEYQLHRVIERKPKEYDLIINLPFRTGKSTLLTICLPVYAWLMEASLKFITGSYIDKLAVEHAVRSRRLLESEWFTRVFKPKFDFVGDQNVKSFYENNFGGYRIATSVGGGLGMGGNIIIIDDPLSRENALSEPRRTTANDWVKQTVSTRLNEPEIDLIIIVMQRLHEKDTTGEMLEEKDGWKQICLPAEESPDVNPPALKKHYTNKLMFPDRFNRKVLKNFKARLGSFQYAAQIQQRPSPEEGGLFKKKWWGFWKPKDKRYPAPQMKLPDGTVHTFNMVNLPDQFDNMITSWDTTFKNTVGSDRVSGQCWAAKETDQFLLDELIGHFDFVEFLKALMMFYKRHPEATATLIEDTANGPAVISTCKNKIPNLIPVKPIGSKFSRVIDASKAMSMIAQCEAGHLFLPHPTEAPWVWDYMNEYAVFPNGRYDDRIDAGSQANRKLSFVTSPGVFSI